MADLKRGATRAPAVRALAMGAAALMTVALGAEAQAFSFSWAGHHDAPADAPPPERRFTFPWASHVDPMNGNFAARQFVQKRLTPGLPMSEAVERVRAAHASCRGGYHRGGGAVVCRYTISSASDMASLGQEIWTVTLTPGPDGKLAGAAVDRSRAGIPGELGSRAVFHWEFGDE
ncbi:MAG TPA: hypothetical protein VN694_10950 [Caulobacteraceae bacterium]|nr:hypothetical protein [Caulobacteraceae bacterium]